MFQRILLLSALLALPLMSCGRSVTPEEAKAIAKEAYVWGFPITENYKTLTAYVLDQSSPEYKAPFNQLSHTARVFTPEDRAVVTPNSDTPYSMLWMDLRAEPLVLTVPEIQDDRYYSVQLIDIYTHNFAYIGSRTTGNDAGNFLIAGPGWSGEVPDGIEEVFTSETDLVFAIYRTQLFEPEDLENVTRLQAGYGVQMLSTFTGAESPAPEAPELAGWDRAAAENVGWIGLLNDMLAFAPVHSSERDLRKRFEKIGIKAGEPFDATGMDDAVVAAIEEGFAEAREEIRQAAAGVPDPRGYFGTREALENDYMRRTLGAALGLYGNSMEEALYPAYFTDGNGRPLDAGRHNYQVRFAADALPPVHAFWSITMYDADTQLLVDNSLDRYLINSTMLKDLRKDSDGGITIYIQDDYPGAARRANWLPAPEGPFYVIMRLYWPQEPALTGDWTLPVIERLE